MFLYGLFGWTGVIVTLAPAVIYQIYDHIKYPNKFRGDCGYCGRNHGRVEWWNTTLGQSYSRENGYIYLSKDCFNRWSKENYICSSCNNVDKYLASTITHKNKREYYYFCSTSCKSKFKRNNPKLFHEGYERHSIPSELRKIVYKRDGGKCKRCGSDQDIHYDHIIPVSKGGSTSENNLELLCQTCNLSKSDRIE
jgi:5-methylcytosine-specific restriction endonuclease McrA